LAIGSLLLSPCGLCATATADRDEEALVRALYFAMLPTEHNATSWIGTKVTAQADGEVPDQRDARTGAMETTCYKFARVWAAAHLGTLMPAARTGPRRAIQAVDP
jgi:hypothetical protein